MAWQFEAIPEGHRLEKQWRQVTAALAETLPDPGKVKAEMGWSDYSTTDGFQFRAKVGEGRGRIFKAWQTTSACPLPFDFAETLSRVIAEQAP